MLNFYRTGLLLFLFAALVSCNSGADNYTAYFGGVVNNPSSRYVILSSGNKVIDTLPLDKNNSFFKKYDSLAPGLYSFRHDPDYHYVYFDKNDSIAVSVDGLNFDESILFSGKGAKKNNFMMELYLANEKDRKQFPAIYDGSVIVFNRKSDSIYKRRLDFYEQKKKEIGWSKGFDFYAKARLDLNYYTKKERYPYVHAMRMGENVRPQLHSTYYAFRKKINFNDPKLIHFSPFARYLTSMLNNRASAKEHTDMDNKALIENIEKLRIADSIFTDKDIKNEVLDNIAFAYILEDQNIANNEKFLDQYIKLSTNKDNDIKKMGRAIKLLRPGQKIPAISLVDGNNIAFDINRDIEKETVIFFWTACARLQFDMMHEKVKALKKEHPNVNFLAVNVDEKREWERMLNEYNFFGAKALHANNFNELKFKWVFTKINRTIILNPDGTIKNAFTNLMDDQFESYLN